MEFFGGFSGASAVFLRSDIGLDQAGGTSARSFGRAPAAPPKPLTLIDRIQDRFPDFDPAPDLGSRIGSVEWFREVATCAGLITVTLLLSPGFERPIHGAVTAPLTGTEWEDARSQSISALAYGATTGMRGEASGLVRPLADTPERPILELTAVVGAGSRFASALERAGVGSGDASRVADLVAGAIDPTDIKAGTRVDVTLGRRASRNQARPLEKLAFRARFDLAVEVARVDGGLSLIEIPIAVDHTPLRIRGRVGSSLYRTARAAGAPAKAVEAFIKSIATKVPMSRIGANDEFDLIVERQRAATGEEQLGKLLFAGLDQGRLEVQLVRWEREGRTMWYDPKGMGERTEGMLMPAQGRLSSSFGYRTHPVLGFRRLHKGMDIAAPTGTPIRAATDGTVQFAGRNGGYGNYVRISHSGGYQTAYGHMSRISVRSGTRVTRGQVIGAVGSTGMSTGPHLHYELWKNGQAINPRSVSLSNTDRLTGSELNRFRGVVSSLLGTPVAGSAKASDTDAAE